MSSIPIGSTGGTLPDVSLHAHHKKGVHSATQDGLAADRGPTGSTQGLFGSLMDSVTELIGVKPAAAASAARTGQKL
jgi:hypothetical protein